MFKIIVYRNGKNVLQKSFGSIDAAYDFYDQCMLKFDHNYEVEFI